MTEGIVEDPSILGIGELILKDQGRNQPGAGRLDLPFQYPDSNLCYEVEIQLGKTNERHIFRTIEYWLLQRKHYPHLEERELLIRKALVYFKEADGNEMPKMLIPLDWKKVKSFFLRTFV